MYKRILLPLDGSGLAEQSLPHAVAHAESFGAELILLRVLEPILPTGTIAPLATAKRAENLTEAWAREYLARIATDVQERGVTVSTVIIEGRPRTKILEFAEENQVDLIVMSTRGLSGPSRWLMGGVADRVVRGSNVPVLLVRIVKLTR
jgi:nucleotide-binding universal stress UspA family protein